MVIGSPNIALAAAVAGLLGIYAEFLRPGLIVPGVAGATLVILAIPSVRPSVVDPGIALALLLPLVLITGYLLRIAVRARRNKQAVNRF